MATFKLEIRKQYGQLSRRIYAQGAAAPDYDGTFGTIQEVLKGLDADLDAAGAKGADAIIFRNIEYEDRAQLRNAVLHAPY